MQHSWLHAQSLLSYSDSVYEEDFNKLPTFTLYGGEFVRKIKLCTKNTGITYSTQKENELYLTAYLFDYRRSQVEMGNNSYHLLAFNSSISIPYHAEN